MTSDQGIRTTGGDQPLTMGRLNELEAENAKLRAEVETLRQAVGLMTTIKPSMEVRVDDPIGMAQEVAAYAQERREVPERVQSAAWRAGSTNPDRADVRICVEWIASQTHPLTEAQRLRAALAAAPAPAGVEVPEDVRRFAEMQKRLHEDYDDEEDCPPLDAYPTDADRRAAAEFILSLPAASPAAPLPAGAKPEAPQADAELDALAHEAECIRGDLDYDDSRATVVLLSIIAKMLALKGKP